jgi:hypothetical protein
MSPKEALALSSIKQIKQYENVVDSETLNISEITFTETQYLA